jgi:hypothetical protein
VHRLPRHPVTVGHLRHRRVLFQDFQHRPVPLLQHPQLHQPAKIYPSKPPQGVMIYLFRRQLHPNVAGPSIIEILVLTGTYLRNLGVP